MISIREASGKDVPAIREIFRACYGADYSDPHFGEEQLLTRLVYSDDAVVLVAEQTETGKVLGTASVILDAGACSDLVGEFGRLAVCPDARHAGIGKLLMGERLRRVRDRLQVGLCEARVSHPWTLRIVDAHGFAVVGFLPLKWLLQQRESLALHVRYFGEALALRNQHPRVIPEVHALAHLALENCGLAPNLIVDEVSPAYPPAADFQVQELTTEGYPALLRIERGRVHHREVFGPLRLHYGTFKLRARRSRYLIAREQGRVAGAVGFTLDPVEKAARVFELISLHDDVIRFLLGELERCCREEWGVCYVEVDVSAHAPRMQRTLLELGFLPAAYVPALVFHEVERLDVVKMVRLLVPPEVRTEALTPRARAVADVVLRLLRSRAVLPRVAHAVQGLSLFGGLNAEQVNRLAGVCAVKEFKAGMGIFAEGEVSREMYVLLRGEAAISVAGCAAPVSTVGAGECLGEISLLTAAPRSATATARTSLEAAVLGHADLAELVRLRPDIGLQIYKNLALGLGEKLKRSGESLARRQ
jgi:GNAT superfamily N-acetyltransferase